MKTNRLVSAALAALFAVALSVGSAFAAAKPAPAGKINLNTATADQLTAVPGIGEKLAARIVEHRRVHGRFHHVDELLLVPGIGPRLLERLRPWLREPTH